MRYTFTKQKKNTSELRFNEILDSVRNITLDPIKEIAVGYLFYDELLKSARDTTNKKGGLLGSLYGVKIIIDPSLKPDEYRVVPNHSFLNE